MELGNLANVSIGDLIDSWNKQNSAEVRRSSDLRPRMTLNIPIDLSTARTVQNPLVIANPFNGVFVQEASDVSAEVQMSLGGYDEYNLGNPVTLTSNASFKSDTAIKQCAFTWVAQPGQSMIVVLFLGIDFRPGSQLSQISGGISLIGGTSVETGTLGSTGVAASVSVTSASAVQLCVVNSTRKSLNFTTDQDIWVGDSAVAVNRGTKIPAGNFQWTNQAALYAIAASATATVSGSEEE